MFRDMEDVNLPLSRIGSSVLICTCASRVILETFKSDFRGVTSLGGSELRACALELVDVALSVVVAQFEDKRDEALKIIGEKPT